MCKKVIKSSKTVCIIGFIRPVNLKSAKEYIITTLQSEFLTSKNEEINEITENQVMDTWMNGVKSSVLLTFTQEEIASFCVSCLSGKRWPETNPSIFQVYLYPEDVEAHRKRNTDAILPDPNDSTGNRKRKREGDKTIESINDEYNDNNEETQEEKNLEKSKDEMEEEIPTEIQEALEFGKPAHQKTTNKCKQRIYYSTVDPYIVNERLKGNWIYENPFAEAYDNIPSKYQYRNSKHFHKRNHNRYDRKRDGQNFQE